MAESSEQYCELPGLSLEGAGLVAGRSQHRAPEELVRRAARSLSTILITGETGVGKGHLAAWIHRECPRSAAPFIPVNCGAIPESLIDSQLFGHAKGAFSGATSDHPGLIRAASGGTLFLDEVAALPSSAQSRLLRLLQEREVQPVGHDRPVVVDVRVIAATSADLREAVEHKTFREDLYFRLNVIHLHVWPLRDRREEIGRLIDQFNDEMAEAYHQRRLVIDPEAQRMLHQHDWPGNVRQLRTIIERLAVLAPGERIDAAKLSSLGHLHARRGAIHRSENAGSILLDHLKSQTVSRVLAESGGSISRAAELIGVHRSTLYRWLKRHPIQGRLEMDQSDS